MKTTSMLKRLMPNIGGPKQKKRQLLMSIAQAPESNVVHSTNLDISLRVQKKHKSAVEATTKDG